MTQKNLSELSNQELDFKLKSLVSRERELFSEILLHICEVDRRKLYLNFSYGSLFDYLTLHLGYSAGSAQRRIDACRLSYEVPGVIKDLQSGALNLSQISLVQKAFRQIQISKNQSLDILNNGLQAQIDTESQFPSLNNLNTTPESNAEFSPENKEKTASDSKAMIAQAKTELLESIKEKSFSESQAVVAKALDIKFKEQAIIRIQADGSVRLEVTFSKEQWEQITIMRDLISHSLPNGSWDQVFVHVAKKVIAAKTNVRSSKREKGRSKSISYNKDEIRSRPVETIETEGDTVGEDSPKEERSYYQNRKILLKQNSCCQYHDKRTSRTCTSKWQLQVDHIKPRWAGGTDEISNLRILCGMHNRAMYREQVGIRFAK